MRSRTTLAALAAAPVLAVTLAAGAGAAPAAVSATPAAPRSLDLPEGTLVAPGPAADLELMFTGDVIGYIEPCG